MLKKLFPFLLLFLLSLIPLLDLLHAGLPITHDGQDHVARIANFSQNLSEGILIPRWAGNLNWGYGHPILMFLYPLPSYFASFFHFLGFTFVDSVKLVFGFSFVISGLGMYFFAKELFGKISGFLAAILYLYAPYRFIDLYVRGALGEHVAFMFVPFIFYFLLKLSRKQSYKYVLAGGFSLTGLILSHNAISLMFLPLIVLYIIYLIYLSKDRKSFLFSSFLMIFMGFGVSAFFWIPAFFEGKYTLRDIVAVKEYAKNFVNFNSLLYSNWSYGGSGFFSVQLGIINILALIAAPFIFIKLFKKNDKNLFLIAGLVLYSVIIIFLMLPISNIIWQKLTILQNFQFPWRFLSVLVFTTSVLGGYVIRQVSVKLQTIVLIIFVTIIIFSVNTYFHARDYLYKPESFFTSIYFSSTDTGESAPIWSVRFMEHLPLKNIEIISGKAKITEFKRSVTKHNYEIISDGKSRIRENTLYFPNWGVKVDNQIVPVEFQDPANRGLITFFVPEGKHMVDIEFKDTKLRTISNLIALITISLFLFFGIVKLAKL